MCNSGEWKFFFPALEDCDILSSCSGRGSAGTGNGARLTWTTASPRKRISSTRRRLNTLSRHRGMAKSSRSFRWILHSGLPRGKGNVRAREAARPAEGMDLHPRQFLGITSRLHSHQTGDEKALERCFHRLSPYSPNPSEAAPKPGPGVVPGAAGTGKPQPSPGESHQHHPVWAVLRLPLMATATGDPPDSFRFLFPEKHKVHRVDGGWCPAGRKPHPAGASACPGTLRWQGGKE